MRPYIPFLLIFSLGTFLRFHALDRQSLWDDEVASLQTISTPLRQAIARFETYETHPPLYFIQLKIWRALGFRSLVKLRLNSALWGTLGLVGIFLAGRRFGGEALGLAAMALLAVSPIHLAYSQELRAYAMATTLGLAALLLLERRSWVALGLAWSALLYTHFWGAFVVLGQAVYGMTSASFKEERKALVRTALWAAGSFGLWIPVLLHQIQASHEAAFWAAPFSVANLAKVFLGYSGMVFTMASSVFYLPARVGVLVVLGLLFGVALIVGLVRGPRAAAVWLSIGLAVPWVLSYWHPSLFVWYRYPVLLYPAFVLLVASGALATTSEVRRRTCLTGRQAWDVARRTVFIGVLLVSQAWGDWIYFHGWQKANPKAVVAYVHHLRQPKTLVIRPSYFSALFQFYDQGTTSVIDEHLLDDAGKRTAFKHHRLILLAFDVPSDPIADALLQERQPVSARYFPGIAHLGITVYELD